MRVLILLLSFFAATATAGENQVFLKERPGKSQVVAQCAICHSLDYITQHAKILDRAGWEKTVGKMINTMGAPVNDTDKRIIIDYLAQNYAK
ncbi:cytochrome c [Candidatus Methylobacter oryzae]|uniref:Cytochrome c n=1 Tax=Candidatus Methylobacter oryzae TaxID=2497749 RepID=A0ABY3CAK6_9GAMM|nr:cytochrome c [Candidatus Methylobacter oryzae]TRW95242.1 cytochrome c [Candidatus Methylobacter oryzae]